MERAAGERRVPWDDSLSRPATAENRELVLWAAAFLPEFFAWLQPGHEVDERGVSRQAYLASRFSTDYLLLDVTGIVTAVEPALQRVLSAQLEAVGYESTIDDDSYRLSGSERSVDMVEPYQMRRRLLAIHFTLNREKRGSSIVPLGRSLMVFGPGPQGGWYYIP